jgi:hypothetical protein
MAHRCRVLLWLCTAYLAVYSIPAHKEFRFLLPALQLAMPFCGAGAAHWMGDNGSGGGSSADGRGGRTRQCAKQGRKQGAAANGEGQPLLRFFACLCMGLQVPMALYFSIWHHRCVCKCVCVWERGGGGSWCLAHLGAGSFLAMLSSLTAVPCWSCACRGAIDVMALIKGRASFDPATSVLFLTPCHATPYYSHVHRPIAMHFIDCSPPGGVKCVHALCWLFLHAGAWCLLCFPENGMHGTE